MIMGDRKSIVQTKWKRSFISFLASHACSRANVSAPPLYNISNSWQKTVSLFPSCLSDSPQVISKRRHQNWAVSGPRNTAPNLDRPTPEITRSHHNSAIRVLNIVTATRWGIGGTAISSHTDEYSSHEWRAKSNVQSSLKRPWYRFSRLVFFRGGESGLICCFPPW